MLAYKNIFHFFSIELVEKGTSAPLTVDEFNRSFPSYSSKTFLSAFFIYPLFFFSVSLPLWVSTVISSVPNLCAEVISYFFLIGLFFRRIEPGGGVLPHDISHTEMWRPKGYSFCAVYSVWKRYRFCPFWSGIGYGFTQGTYGVN